MSRIVLQKISRLTRYRKIEAAVIASLAEPLREMVWRSKFRSAARRVAKQPMPPALIYTMSKVASTAVSEALRSIEGLGVYQVHILSSETIRDVRELLRERGIQGFEKGIDRHEYICRVFQEEFIEPGRPMRVVSLVREPIARNISFYFQVLDQLWQTERAHEKVSLDQLLEEFHERFPHERSLDWFDEELKTVLGIDVYTHPFPRDKGFVRIDSGPYEVLIMRHDLDDRLKEKLLAELFDVPRVSLSPRNVGAEKAYGKVYSEFLRRLTFSEDYADQMLDSKYARHFYGAEELARLRAKWLNERAA